VCVGGEVHEKKKGRLQLLFLARRLSPPATPPIVKVNFDLCSPFPAALFVLQQLM
jgi:hypothetical protein